MKKANCFDCKRLYGHEHGFPDLLIPTWAWNKIAPSGPGSGTEGGGGLLCPSCICKRLHDVGIEKIPSAFVSGPLAYMPNDWILQVPPTVGKRGILKDIMELWRLYKFVKYVDKQTKQEDIEYSKVLNSYREQKQLSERELAYLWNKATKKELLEITGPGYIRVTFEGAQLIEMKGYGFVCEVTKRHGGPIVILAGIASIINLIVILVH